MKKRKESWYDKVATEMIDVWALLKERNCKQLRDVQGKAARVQREGAGAEKEGI